MPRADYLDPRWQQFRLKKLDSAGWKCELCGNKDSTLHIHHTFYISGRKPWQYLPDTTLALCDQCHEEQHEINSDYDRFFVGKWEFKTAKIIQSEARSLASKLRK